MVNKNDEGEERENLITSHNFKINSVIYGVDTYSENNGVIGPGGRSWITGTSPKIIMRVSSEDKAISVEEIEFFGYCNLEAGDRIKAYFPQYSEKHSGRGLRRRTTYHKRELVQKETSIKIEKLNLENKVLAEFIGL